MLCRPYLRVSTTDQDPDRARADLLAFAAERGLVVAKVYREKVSGTTLARPVLRELIDDCQPGEILLLEAVDRLTRLTDADWQHLRAEIKAKGIKIVALDLPTSHALASGSSDEFTRRLTASLNEMLIDVLAAVARKTYEDIRRRQAQGIEKRKAEGGYRGRPEDAKMLRDIDELLALEGESRKSWSRIMEIVGCSRASVAKVAKRRKAEGKM